MQRVLWAQRDRFLSAGPSSLVPNRRGMKGSLCAPWQQETCTDHVDSFRWTVPKRNTNYWFLFFLKPQTRSPKFPQQIKSKLLKGWFTLALISLLPSPLSWCGTLLKRDSATRRCSEDEHHPGDLTQRRCLVPMKTEWEKEDEDGFVTCCEVIDILKVSEWNEEFGVMLSSLRGRQEFCKFRTLAKYSENRKRNGRRGSGFRKSVWLTATIYSEQVYKPARRRFLRENAPWHTVPSMMCNLYLFRVLMKGCMNNLT